MEFIDCLVALGGDIGNTVPRHGVPVSEAAVLLAIHGRDSLSDVVPVRDEAVNARDELERLRKLYKHAHDGRGSPIVEAVYPGSGARVLSKVSDLGLAPVQFKAGVSAGESVDLDQDLFA